MWSSPALNQLFPSGKITAICTDIITTVLELLLVPRTRDCILSCTCAPHRTDRMRDKQYKGAKSRTLGYLEPQTHHSRSPPSSKSSAGPLSPSCCRVRTRWINHKFFLLLVNSKQATLIYQGRYTYKQMVRPCALFFPS